MSDIFDGLSLEDVLRYKLCRFCGCPMKPKGVKKKPNEYDHAQGCPYSRKRKHGHK